MDIKIRPENSDDLYGIYLPVNNPRACVILVHGLGDHINRYKYIADYLNDNDYSFIGVDLPGHGRSPGKRGHIRDLGQCSGIISSMVEWLREREGDIPLILYGHSLGGTVALHYLIYNNDIERGIVTSPWLKLSFEPPRFKMILASLGSRILPSLLQPSGLDPEDICSVEEVVNEYRKDIYIHSLISVGLFASAVRTASKLLKVRDELQKRVLIIHSDKDKITSAEGSAIFAGQNSIADLKIWNKGYHELHNEPFRDEVMSYIINWLDVTNGTQDKNRKATSKRED